MINYRWRIALLVSVVTNLGIVLLAAASYPDVGKVQPQSIVIDFSLDTKRPESQMMETKSQRAPESVKTESVPEKLHTAASEMEVSPTMSVQENFEAQGSEGQSRKDVPVPQAAGQPSESLRSSAGYTPPRLVKRVEPIYPDSARMRGLSGRVRVKAMITAGGTVGECRIIESSGVPDLDQAALAAIAGWKFVPATDRSTGNAIDAYVTLPVVFRLR